MKATQREVMCRASRYTSMVSRKRRSVSNSRAASIVGSTTENKAANA